MQLGIVTLFPEMFAAVTDYGISGRAVRAGLMNLEFFNPRDFTTDKHRTVDDRPYGGGPGMVLKPEPIFSAIEEVEQASGPFHKILLCPRGRTFDRARAHELSRVERLMFVCGRYEGFDERIRSGLAASDGGYEEISLGDFVLAGGELPAMVVLEAAVRLIPGVLGCAESAQLESFEGELLDHPQYTRPREFRGMGVPEVLFSGDHARIAQWREEQARSLTASKLALEGRDEDVHRRGAPPTA